MRKQRHVQTKTQQKKKYPNNENQPQSRHTMYLWANKKKKVINFRKNQKETTIIFVLHKTKHTKIIRKELF